MGLLAPWKSRPAEPVDVYKRVVATRYCIKCGAQLRGHSVDAACPTCQHPVYDSIYGGFLIDMPARESRRLYNMSAVVFYPALFLAGLTGFMVLVTICSARDLSRAVDGVFDAVLFCAMLSAIVALVGTVVFTGRRTAAYYLAKYGNTWSVVKVGLITAGVVAVLIATWSYPTQCVFQVAFAGVPGAVFLQRLGHMMQLVPNKKLGAHANTASAAAVVVALAALLVLLLRPAAQPGSETAGFVLVLSLLTTLGGLGLGMAILRLVILARRTLQAVYQRTPEPSGR